MLILDNVCKKISNIVSTQQLTTSSINNFFWWVDLAAMACRAHRQKVARMAHVLFIVKRLFKKLSTPEHQRRMVTTSRLLPLGSLKRKTLKVLFSGWVEKRFKGCGRILTRKVAEATVRRLRSKLELPDCHDLEDEINRMHYFLKVARKRLGPGKEKAMSTMDALETIPMEESDADKEFYMSLMNQCRQDWLFVFQVDKNHLPATVPNKNLLTPAMAPSGHMPCNHP